MAYGRTRRATVLCCAVPVHTSPNLRTLLAFIALAGCAKPPPPDCDTSTDTACFRGVFSGLLGKRMEDVKVCAPELDLPCETSDADGGWTMAGLPLDSDVLIKATAEDSVDTIFPQHTSMDWYGWYKVMVPQNILETHAERLDVTLDPEKGHVFFFIWEGLNIDGENTDKIEGVVARAGGGQVFYGNSLGLASADATETTGNGSGGILNLEPGVVDIVFEAPGGPCTEHDFHWKINPDGSFPVPIRAGFTTAIDLICPPSP